MKNLFEKSSVAGVFVLAGMCAMAETMDRPQGFKIGQRMTLKPYVAASATYDSNVECRHGGSDDVFWTINPGLNLEYKADSWSVNANAYYQYNAYCKHTNEGNYDYHGYGEDVTFRWTDALPFEPGWSVILSENYQKTNPTDDMMNDGGCGYACSRHQVRFGAVVMRRFAHQLHAAVNTGYYRLDYDDVRNDSRSGMYGWDRWIVGTELGWAPSQWTDFLVAANYQGYSQENNRSSAYANQNLSSNSDGWTLQAGMGSYATDRIKYRLLGGWSRFEYAGSNGKTDNGFIYTGSGDWRMSDTWEMMIIASSYYQPSEREYGSSQRTDNLSWGVAKSMVRGKLTSTFDISYRREDHGYVSESSSSYNLNLLTFRLGVNYYLNRFLTLFGNAEYRLTGVDGCAADDMEDYEYDRFRATLGARLTY